MMSGSLVNGSNQTAVPFQFPFVVLLHGRGTFFNLQSSSPSSTSSLITNFIPRRLQLHPSSPTSTLVTFQFPNPVAFIFPPLLLDARGVLDAAAVR
jgi:hypothetical protein